MLYVCYVHKKDHALYELCHVGVCSGEKIYMFLVCQVSWLVRNFNFRSFSDTIKVVIAKFCTMVLHSECYLFITLSVTLTLFQGQSSVNNLNSFNWKFYVLTWLNRNVVGLFSTSSRSWICHYFFTFTHIKVRSLTCFLIWQKLCRWLFHRDCSSQVF